MSSETPGAATTVELPVNEIGSTRNDSPRLANPKSIAYYPSIFAALFPPDPPAWLYAAGVGTAVLVSGVWWTSVALFFAMKPARRAYERARRAIDAVIGGVLVCLGVRMALSR